MKLFEDSRKYRAAVSAGDAKPPSSRRVLAALPLVLACLLPASASAGENSFESLPQNFRYSRDYDLRPPTLSFRRDQERSVEAPTQFRLKSILKYTTPIGQTGLLLRLQMPLKKRKIVKIEIRF